MANGFFVLYRKADISYNISHHQMIETEKNMHEGHRSRLRETYLAGAGGMHEHQLLELLLTYAIPRRDTNLLAHRLIARCGSLPAVLKADVGDLTQEEGIGLSAAVLISLVGRLQGCAAPAPAGRLNTPDEAESFCRRLLRNERYEAMYAISLDKSRRVLHSDRISEGTLTELVVYPRLVVECALRHKANGIILTHNHPSGDCAPSRDDITTTQTVLEAQTPVGITLQDHIIVGRDGAYSMVRGAVLPGGEVAEPLASAAVRKE